MMQKFVIVFVCVVLGLCAATPKLNCDFSCHYREYQTYRVAATNHLFKHFSSLPLPSANKQLVNPYTNVADPGFGDYDVSFMWYAIENKYITQAYIEDNSTLIWHAPFTYYQWWPFFDRYSCVKSEIRNAPPPHCPTFASGATLAQASVACPLDKSKMCERWEWHSSNYGEYHELYLYKGTNYPNYITIENEDYLLVEEFADYNSTAPEYAMFIPPKTQPCTDLTDGDDAKVTRKQLDMSLPINSPLALSELRPTGWKAGPQQVFNGMTFADLQAKLAPLMVSRDHKRSSKPQKTNVPYRVPVTVPVSFDSRTAWPNCTSIASVRDQGNCGSCWAFSTAETMADRVCVSKKINVTLSPQHLVECSTKNAGCNGGYLDYSWYFVRDNGLVTEACMPYKAANGKCPYKCVDGSSFAYYKARSAYSVFVPFDYAKTANFIQQELIANGPVAASFYVFDDFSHYAGGVYSRTKGSALLGGHAVKIVGYGKDKVPYWLVTNSWSETWGESGFFRIKMGSNECGIESGIAAGLPL